MTDLEILLLGYGLGVIPASKTSQLLVAYLGKRLGVKPRQIEQYDNATTGGKDEG
jgi:hypothetical protein